MSAANGAGTAFDGPRASSRTVGSGGHRPPACVHAGDARAPLRLLHDLRPGRQPSRLGRLPGQPRGRIRAQPGPQLRTRATPVNFKLTLTPATATNPVGTPHTVTATLTDTAGTPIAGAPISFAVTGVNTQPGQRYDERERPGDLHLHRHEHRAGSDRRLLRRRQRSAVRGDRLRNQGLDAGLRPQHHQDRTRERRRRRTDQLHLDRHERRPE